MELQRGNKLNRLKELCGRFVRFALPHENHLTNTVPREKFSNAAQLASLPWYYLDVRLPKSVLSDLKQELPILRELAEFTRIWLK